MSQTNYNIVVQDKMARAIDLCNQAALLLDKAEQLLTDAQTSKHFEGLLTVTEQARTKCETALYKTYATESACQEVLELHSEQRTRKLLGMR